MASLLGNLARAGGDAVDKIGKIYGRYDTARTYQSAINMTDEEKQHAIEEIVASDATDAEKREAISAVLNTPSAWQAQEREVEKVAAPSSNMLQSPEAWDEVVTSRMVGAMPYIEQTRKMQGLSPEEVARERERIANNARTAAFDAGAFTEAAEPLELEEEEATPALSANAFMEAPVELARQETPKLAVGDYEASSGASARKSASDKKLSSRREQTQEAVGGDYLDNILNMMASEHGAAIDPTEEMLRDVALQEQLKEIYSPRPEARDVEFKKRKLNALKNAKLKESLWGADIGWQSDVANREIANLEREIASADAAGQAWDARRKEIIDSYSKKEIKRRDTLDDVGKLSVDRYKAVLNAQTQQMLGQLRHSASAGQNNASKFAAALNFFGTQARDFQKYSDKATAALGLLKQAEAIAAFKKKMPITQLTKLDKNLHGALYSALAELGLSKNDIENRPFSEIQHMVQGRAGEMAMKSELANAAGNDLVRSVYGQDIVKDAPKNKEDDSWVVIRKD